MTNEERGARIESLTDAIAETNRTVNALAGEVAENSRTVATLLEVWQRPTARSAHWSKR